jgi:RNA polymerase sigma-70 factor (ECF subfamily)
MSAVTAEQLDELRGRLRSFCYQMLGSPFDAEDAVQDALERAWRARAQYDGARSSLITWCFRIARNVCIDRLRETGRRGLPRDLQEPGIDIGAGRRPARPAAENRWSLPNTSDRRSWPCSPRSREELSQIETHSVCSQ